MFEMRWLETMTNTCGVEGCNEESCKGTIKVLQFRTGKMVDAERGSQRSLWTEWQDVPTEKGT